MDDMKRLIAIILLSATVSEISCSQELEPVHGKVIGQLNISKNFKGFSYGVEENIPNKLSVSILPGAFKDKNLVGIILNFSEKGKIESIEPLFIDREEAFDPIALAFNLFEGGKIGLDSLWEMVRACIPKEATDIHALSFLIGTIESADVYPSLEDIKIPEGGPFHKALSKIKFTENLDGEKKWLNLAEVKIALK